MIAAAVMAAGTESGIDEANASKNEILNDENFKMYLSHWNQWKSVDGDSNGLYEFHGSLNLKASTFAQYLEMGFCFTLNKDSKNYVAGEEKLDCYQNKFSQNPEVVNCLVQDANGMSSLDSDAIATSDPAKNWVATDYDDVTKKCVTFTDT